MADERKDISEEDCPGLMAFIVRSNSIVMNYFSCREWWYFALNANLHEIREQRKRCTWDFLLHRARDAVSYTDKYFSKLKGGLLSAEDKVRGLSPCICYLHSEDKNVVLSKADKIGIYKEIKSLVKEYNFTR